MLEYAIDAQRVDASGSVALVRQARVLLDTSPAGRSDVFNPAEMLLAALAACIIKSAERAMPLLGFKLRAMNVRLHAVRSDSPPRITPHRLPCDGRHRRKRSSHSAPAHQYSEVRHNLEYVGGGGCAGRARRAGFAGRLIAGRPRLQAAITRCLSRRAWCPRLSL